MTMAKITFMGAGSTVFAKNVLGDAMLTPCLQDAEIALYDIDADRLDESYLLITKLNENINENRAKISKYLGVENRKDALRGADFVVDAIQVGLYDPCTIIDFEVPKKYGLRQTIGDTLGIGGIFRALRTIVVLKEFVKAVTSSPFGLTDDSLVDDLPRRGIEFSVVVVHYTSLGSTPIVIARHIGHISIAGSAYEGIPVPGIPVCSYIPVETFCMPFIQIASV